jgi:hypothetical protein
MEKKLKNKNISRLFLITTIFALLFANVAYAEGEEVPEIVEPECLVDAECDDSDECTNDYCTDEICHNDFSDDEGPITSDLLVDPFYNNGIFDITATAEDTCSAIEEAEYFVGHAGTEHCGDEGTGTPMDALDEDFNDLIEDLISENVNQFEDGANWACVQSKDTEDNWGDCECYTFESDTIPPDYPYDIFLNDEIYPDEYLICGDDPTLTATVCDQETHIQGGEYFLDLIMPPIPTPWSGFWMDPTGAFQLNGWHCDIITALVDLTELEDGTHDIKLRGKDGVENWGKISQWPYNVTFIKDTTPPDTYKDIVFEGDISVPCDEQEMNGETITDGCYYALPGTQIFLTAEDPDPQGTGEFAGDVYIYYKVWWSYDGSSWEVIEQGQSGLDEGIDFTLMNDSYHLIEYWATDGCSWEEEHHFELDIIDTQHPESWKELQGPQVDCTQDEILLYGIEDCAYVNQQTLVNLYCEDVEPHPVNDVTLYYKVDWKEYWEDSWDEGTWLAMDGSFEFNYQKDSFHKLTWYCEDALGNVEREHVELDIVDTQAPVLEKFVGEPKIPCENKDGCHYWITQDTPISFTCEDLGPHPVDDVSIYYRYKVDDGSWTDYIIYNGPFTFNEDSRHELEYYCEDALNNTAGPYTEIDRVDSTPPTTTKTLVGQKYPCQDGQDCHFWIRQDTELCMSAEDGGDICHIDGVETYYRYNVDEGNWTDWMLYEGCFSYDEDSNHTVEYYSKDQLNNTEVVQVEIDRVDTAPPEINKFIVKESGERFYSPEEGVVTVGFQSNEYIKFCAEVNDVKLTGDEGVGVRAVGMRLTGLPDPELIWDEDEQAYCRETQTIDHCGFWHYEVRAKDWLENHAPWEDGIQIIVDDVAPIGEVLNPHAGNNYYAEKIFPFYAPAVDFGGNFCMPDFGMPLADKCPPPPNECPATGVDYCDVYAIDYNFEGMNQSEIKKCWWDLDIYFEQVFADPYMEYIGRVPYEDGVCNGYLTIPEDTELSDTVFMAVDWVDKAGNSRFGLALNPWLSPITMNMEEQGHVAITEMFKTAEPGELTVVKADLYESDLSGTKECRGIVEKYSEEERDVDYIMTYTGQVTGDAIEGYECMILGVIPSYVEDGSYRYTVQYLLNDDWQVFEIGSDWFDFTVGDLVVDPEPEPEPTPEPSNSGGGGGSSGSSKTTSCGDHTCDSDENYASCPSDCAQVPLTTISEGTDVAQQLSENGENLETSSEENGLDSITGAVTAGSKAGANSVVAWLLVILALGVTIYFIARKK